MYSQQRKILTTKIFDLLHCIAITISLSMVLINLVKTFSEHDPKMHSLYSTLLQHTHRDTHGDVPTATTGV